MDTAHAALEGLQRRPLGLWLVVATVLAAASLALTVWLVVRLPADAFCAARPADRSVAGRLRQVARNLLGVLLICAGVVLSLPGVPGQGLLTLLLGLALLDLPGKRRLELRLLRRPAIRRAIDRTRRYFGRPPLELPEPGDDGRT